MATDENSSLDRFDLGDAPDVDVTELQAAARTLEQTVEADADVSDADTDDLAALVSACKRLEDAAEEARKDVYEPELDDRVSEGEQVGDLHKRSGASSYVTDAEGAFAAVSDAGADPLDVAKVSVGDLRDVLGGDADAFVGQSEYSYFVRD